MARIRYLKPEFFQDPDLIDLPFEARLFYAGLWCQADKAGRLRDRPRELKLQIFPGDEVDVGAVLERLAQPKNGSGQPFIHRYEAEGQQYIQILRWAEHQRPHHTERESQIPSPPHTPPMGKGMGKGKQHGVKQRGRNGDVTVKTPLHSALLAEFEQEFWPGVPNKIDKKKARVEYIKARKATPKETILAGLPGYRAKEARRAKQAGYERHSPFRWLRDERWTDEIPEARSAATSAQKLCACGCGKPATLEVSNKGFATVECRKKVLRW